MVELLQHVGFYPRSRPGRGTKGRPVPRAASAKAHFAGSQPSLMQEMLSASRHLFARPDHRCSSTRSMQSTGRKHLRPFKSRPKGFPVARCQGYPRPLRRRLLLPRCLVSSLDQGADGLIRRLAECQSASQTEEESKSTQSELAFWPGDDSPETRPVATSDLHIDTQLLEFRRQ